MLVVRAISRGFITSVVAVVLYLVVAVLVPLVVAVYQSSVSGGGGGMTGFSILLELPLVVAVVGFLAGFGWTFLERWARQPAGGGVKEGPISPED